MELRQYIRNAISENASSEAYKFGLISVYECQYMRALKDIFEIGYSDGVNERTGYETKRLPNVVITVDVEKEFPILKSKFVAAKTAQREIEWIWKMQTSDVSKLKAKIWDEWVDENNTIGKAYGYQMNKPVDIFLDPIHKKEPRHYDNQAEFIIQYLKENPNGRWATATLWSVEDLKDMQLVPCVHTSNWNLDGGRLNCCLLQRSGDMPYGVPFNTTQYAELMIMIARDLGVKPGILTHVIADAHIYANQMDGVKVQISRFKIMQVFRNLLFSYMHNSGLKNEHESLVLETMIEKYVEKYEKERTPEQLVDSIIEAMKNKPKFNINTEETDFFKYDADDCSVDNYKHLGKIDFGDVAV